MSSGIGRLHTIGRLVYEAIKAGSNSARTGESDEYCYEHDTRRPCAFLKDGRCSKPSDAPSCSSLKGKASIVFRLSGTHVNSCEFAPTGKDVKCFSCGCVIPGKDTSMDVADEIKETGAAHFIYKYTRNGEAGEFHVCCLCELIAGVMGQRDTHTHGEFAPRFLSYKARKAKQQIIREFNNGVSLEELLDKYVWRDEKNDKEIES